MQSVRATYREVGDTATSTELVGPDSARKGVSIFNDSAAILYVLVGTGTAAAAQCSVEMAAQDYWEAPYGYAGEIQGVWESDAGGEARITEYF